ncbi:hypothetical protein EWM64_g735 [Hericium alpestre]|uniref:Anaphase-promoting complex subunit 4 WD40 domain-containing protein n=1 Tax=Hericium alpestre TaxID=135208 RepID=A0A4Z0AAI0_9AGAM|nr:hypothetical protein EWM64_g735 [Hericium alpestre]
MLTALRRSVSQLFYSPSVVPPTSSSANLAKRRQFILALDGPGIPQDPWAYPLTWSRRNVIAVACGHDVYYQNLDTRQISHLCNLPTASHGRIRTIAFAQGDMPDVVCMGTTTGNLQVWDTASEKLLRKWPNHDWMGVSALDWRDRECTIGRMDGRIALYDLRQRDAVFKIKAHREDVYGLKWSPDGRYLLIHRDQAVAWCPWKPDLLATGGTYPDGTIQIWSTATLTSSPSPTPLHTIPLDSSIYSLQWSPHCKELLSTHGLSWQGSRGERLPSKVDPIASPLTNSVTVHSYPSLNRLVSVTAHTGTVGQSCLGPDGTMVFTICYREEAMKMWKVWGRREESDKRESTFDRYSIR